ncbi:MAG: hypothetical protein PCFJNLEI_00558 [Verrucomicrobiae bacterium]|nr:hypothetical protein [Verrucomicrobiae bacterium]
MKTKNPLVVRAAPLLLAILTACTTRPKVSEVQEWKPVEQPGLAAALASAPELKFEEFAEGPSVCVEGPIWWVPNTGGKTWDMVIIYSRGYPGPHEAFIYDTATKELKKAAVPELEKVRSNFHIVPYFLINGKMIIRPGIGSDVCIYTYDPAANELKFGGYPLGENVVSADGQMAPNADGSLFGGFGPFGGDKTNRARVGFYTIDPVTLKGELLGEVGPPSDSRAWEYGGVVMDGDWIYARYGHSPWRLYGMNVKTHKGKVIAETEQIIGDRQTITFRTNSEYPGIYVTITGLKGAPKDETKAFWLLDGELTPCALQDMRASTAKPVPPIPGEKRAHPRGNFYGGSVPKGMEVIQGRPDADGKVTIWYRFSDASMAEAVQTTTGVWQRVELPPVKLYPNPIRRMANLSDGSLFALGESYGQALVFDPKTKQRKILGATMSVYSLLPVADKLYLCGYPSSQVWIYDPAKPWTVGAAMPADTPPDNGNEAEATAKSNPAKVAVLKEFADIHMPWAAAEGADGRVYFGGKVVRIGEGGGLGWWDPRENKGGGFHKPFDNYPVFWMCSAANGRYILCSTKTAASPDNTDYIPPRGRIFVYDTTKHELIHQFEDERLVMPGYITEAQPGLVMGYAPIKDAAGKYTGLLYGFDPAAGKILWTKSVPLAPQTAFSFMKRGKYFFAKGPDGFIWATMNGVLARINPQTAEVLPVGKMEDNPLAFVNGDVYVAGSNKFRRIVGIQVKP